MQPYYTFSSAPLTLGCSLTGVTRPVLICKGPVVSDCHTVWGRPFIITMQTTPQVVKTV